MLTRVLDYGWPKDIGFEQGAIFQPSTSTHLIEHLF
jgi:hypothetical protein